MFPWSPDPSFRCTKRFKFSAAHRLAMHEGKCANIHGHNFVAEVEFEGSRDDMGMVIDFGVVKSLLGSWIDENWDHACILAQEDESALAALKGIDSHVYPLPYTPTAENLALFLATAVCPSVFSGKGVRARRVTVWETDSCSATAELW